MINELRAENYIRTKKGLAVVEAAIGRGGPHVAADTRIAESHCDSLAAMRAAAIADGEPDPELGAATTAARPSNSTMAALIGKAIKEARAEARSEPFATPQAPVAQCAAHAAITVEKARELEINAIVARISGVPALEVEGSAARRAEADSARAAASEAAAADQAEAEAIAARIAVA